MGPDCTPGLHPYIHDIQGHNRGHPSLCRPLYGRPQSASLIAFCYGVSYADGRNSARTFLESNLNISQPNSVENAAANSTLKKRMNVAAVENWTCRSAGAFAGAGIDDIIAC